jgi:sugar lactone lactonase YvrE
LPRLRRKIGLASVDSDRDNFVGTEEALMMKRFCFLVIGAFLAGCGAPGALGGASVAPQAGVAPADGLLKAHPHVYWTLRAGAGSGSPQVQLALAPLEKKSKATTIYNNPQNMLLDTSGMAVDSSGRLWILDLGPGNGDPGSVSVFDLPLTANSAPKYTFALSGTDGPFHLTFDRSGDLWVTSESNSTVLEYTGPFKKSGTLSPKRKLTKGIDNPQGIAVDAHGNLYVSNYSGSLAGKDSIAIFAKPISNKSPKYLEGLAQPGGLIFDKHGNLYAYDNYGNRGTVRYDSNDLKPADKPSIVDDTGLPGGTVQVDFGLSETGDLYFTSCGSFDGVVVYPTRLHRFFIRIRISRMAGVPGASQ